MRSHLLFCALITIGFSWITLAPSDANAQHGAQYASGTARVLPNVVTYSPFDTFPPTYYYFPAMYPAPAYYFYPGMYYSTYGYSYPMYPVYYPAPVYYPTVSYYPSPVFVPAVHAAFYSSFYYPAGYSYYYYRGW